MRFATIEKIKGKSKQRLLAILKRVSKVFRELEKTLASVYYI